MVRSSMLSGPYAIKRQGGDFILFSAAFFALSIQSPGKNAPNLLALNSSEEELDIQIDRNSIFYAWIVWKAIMGGKYRGVSNWVCSLFCHFLTNNTI